MGHLPEMSVVELDELAMVITVAVVGSFDCDCILDIELMVELPTQGLSLALPHPKLTLTLLVVRPTLEDVVQDEAAFIGLAEVGEVPQLLAVGMQVERPSYLPLLVCH